MDASAPYPEAEQMRVDATFGRQGDARREPVEHVSELPGEDAREPGADFGVVESAMRARCGGVERNQFHRIVRPTSALTGPGSG